MGKATIRKVKEAFDKTDEPFAMLAILRMEIARQYLLGGAQKPDRDAAPAPREVILSSYLVGADEECHTAQSRFLALLQNTSDHPTLAQIEEAFSVESVTEEFFREYVRLTINTNKTLRAFVLGRSNIQIVNCYARVFESADVDSAIR